MNNPESNWKLLRERPETALQRNCGGVLHEYRDVLDRAAESPHALLLELFEVTQRRNGQLAGASRHLRGSTAFHPLISMREPCVITEEELLLFSAETHATLERLGPL